MKRLTWYLLCLLSLALCVGSSWLCVRSRTTGDTLLLSHSDSTPPSHFRFIQFWSAGGGLRILLGFHRYTLDTPPTNPKPHFDARHAPYSPGPRPYPINRFDGQSHTAAWFEYFWKDYAIPTYSEWQRSITVPHALLIFLTAIPPFLLTRQLLRRRSSRTGLCPRCGYDLRATPHRCPECGHIPPSTPPRLQNPKDFPRTHPPRS